MTKEQPQVQEPSYTIEEINKMREESKKFYEAELPVIKLKVEYEDLIAQLEESKLRRYTAMMRLASMMAPPPKDPSKENLKDTQEIAKKMKEAVGG